MVAASPSLTTNALARMLEERPDPSAFQPVLQIAGNCFVYVFSLLNDTLAFYSSSSSKESIHSLRERDRIFEYKRIARDSIFDVSPLFFSVYSHIITLSLSHADIRKIKNTTGEPESAENTRYRVMIRYVFCLEIIASQIWALFEFLFFHSVASFFSSGLRDDSSSSSSSALKRCARENARHHSLTFFFVRLLLLLLLLLLLQRWRLVFSSDVLAKVESVDRFRYVFQTTQGGCLLERNPLFVSTIEKRLVFLFLSLIFILLRKDHFKCAFCRRLTLSLFSLNTFVKNRATAKVHRRARLGRHVQHGRGQGDADYHAVGSSRSRAIDHGEPAELREEADDWWWESAAAVRGAAVWAE
jgi:hypothetical protein